MPKVLYEENTKFRNLDLLFKLKCYVHIFFTENSSLNATLQIYSIAKNCGNITFLILALIYKAF